MWKPIRDFEGHYEVNKKGQIRSVERMITDSVGHTYKIKKRIMKPLVMPNGYLQISLCKNNIAHHLYVHRIVAEAFIPNPHNYPIVNHINGNKKDCSVKNLEWCTYSENNQHAYDTGLHGRGEDQYRAVLTEKQVKEIRKNGKFDTYKNIGKLYGVSGATIRDVLLRRTWNHVAD